MPTSQTMMKQPLINYILQILVISIFIIIYNLLGLTNPLLFAALTYLIFTIVLRVLILIPYRKGMAYYKKGTYDTAVAEFQKSRVFFLKHRFLDTYRYVILMSNQNSYLEMTLLNLAFCYRQTGETALSKETLIQTLSLFPDSEMAKEELKILSDQTIKAE